ncbi:hypothetical protein MMC32_000896 [Xylographa parallela]|nr:hypothetical protein [Xylographa parallela]
MDDSSKSSKWGVTFLSFYPDLPLSLPTGWPHIIDWDTVEGIFADTGLSIDGFHIANGIATVLHRYDPALLKNFLDLAINQVTFTKKGKSGCGAILVIERNHNTVMVKIDTDPDLPLHADEDCKCGSYTNSVMNGDSVEEWDMRVKYRISGSGRWVPLEYATGVNARDTDRSTKAIAVHGALLTQGMLVNEAWARVDWREIVTT